MQDADDLANGLAVLGKRERSKTLWNRNRGGHCEPCRELILEFRLFLTDDEIPKPYLQDIGYIAYCPFCGAKL